MTGKIVNSIGIVLTVIGTVLTLWTVFITNPTSVGTWGEPLDRAKAFPKEKRRVIVGCSLIVLGGVLQIVSQFLC